jgi:Tfp pilus assembly protein PilV
MRLTHKNIEGFSLAEVAIVLGVIGVILGSLWVLVGQTMESMKQHHLAQDITAVVGNVRAAYANKVSIGGAAQNTWTIMTNLAAMKTIFPGDMTSGAGGWPSSPWSSAAMGTPAVFSTFNVCTWSTGSTKCFLDNSTPAAASPLFAVEVENLTQASCIVAATRDSDLSMPAGLVDVYVNGASVGLGAATPVLPVQPAAAMAQCTLAANTVDFVYRLNPPSAP